MAGGIVTPRERVSDERLAQIAAFPAHTIHNEPGWVTLRHEDLQAMIADIHDARAAQERTWKANIVLAESLRAARARLARIEAWAAKER